MENICYPGGQSTIQHRRLWAITCFGGVTSVILYPVSSLYDPPPHVSRRGGWQDPQSSCGDGETTSASFSPRGFVFVRLPLWLLAWVVIRIDEPRPFFLSSGCSLGESYPCFACLYCGHGRTFGAVPVPATVVSLFLRNMNLLQAAAVRR